MSLLAFHRFLISVGIIFCAGYAILEASGAFRETGSFVLAGIFLSLAGALGFYLMRMDRVLGYDRSATDNEVGERGS